DSSTNRWVTRSSARERHRNRKTRRLLSRWWRRVGIFTLSVDSDRVDEHLALANLRLHVAHRRRARRVDAVRDHEERFLAVLPLLRERNRVGHRVVHRRAAVRRNPPERARQYRAILGPVL